MYHPPSHPSHGLRAWLASLGPITQLALGFLAIGIAVMLTLFCAGTFSALVRPFIFQFAPTPFLPQPTFPPTPPATATATFIPLPRGTVPPTPTQGRIPTRELPTATLDPLITPTLTLSITVSTTRASSTITRTLTTTPTRR